MRNKVYCIEYYETEEIINNEANERKKRKSGGLIQLTSKAKESSKHWTN